MVVIALGSHQTREYCTAGTFPQCAALGRGGDHSPGRVNERHETMGASNVAAAFQTYARVLRDHDKAMRLLVYMANVARDDDSTPWFGMGHAALAEHALGREPGDDGEVSTSDLRAVRRAITTLLNVGAITVTRPANGRRAEHKTVRYRLHLLAPATTDNSNHDDRRTLSGSTVGRSVVHRRTLSGSPWDAERPPKEKEEYEERAEEDLVTSQGEVTTRTYARPQPTEINLDKANGAGLVDMQDWQDRQRRPWSPSSTPEARRRAREIVAAALARRTVPGAEDEDERPRAL